MKNKIRIIAAVCSVLLLVSCSGEGGVSSPSNSSSVNEDGGDGYTYTSVLAQQSSKEIDAGSTIEYSINADISGKEYIKMGFKTDVGLFGTYFYSDIQDSSKKVEENFYIEPNTKMTDFTQFLDAFRENGCGNFNKKLEKITVKNISSAKGNVTLGGVAVTNREISATQKEVYLVSGDLKVGMDLAAGGALTYLERLSYEGDAIEEVLTADGDVVIGIKASEAYPGSTLLSNHVNLINNYDRGRQFQQSFYAAVGGTQKATNGENGYTRAWCLTAGDGGHYWPYNPVQAGNYKCDASQIIDYQVTQDTLYVKTRAMDWAQENSTTKSYMENWYTVKNNMLYVKNRFIDWNGFTGTWNSHSNEMPATYVVQSFNNYVCYEGTEAWTNDALTTKSNLGPWGVTGGYINGVHSEDWFAWTNDQKFGVGVYVPGMGSFASGRVNASKNISVPTNCNAYQSPMTDPDQYLFNKQEATSAYTNCYVMNTCYTAPVMIATMREYIPLEYTYVVSVDFVSSLRGQFKKVATTKEVVNDGLKAWN